MCDLSIAALDATLADIEHEVIAIGGELGDGYTWKINAGLKQAAGDYLICSNDDVTVLDSWWQPLKAALDDGAVVAFPRTINGFMRYDLPAWHYAFTRTTYERFALPGGDWLDPAMRLTYSDTDLLQRLRRQGVIPKFVPYSQIEHGLSQTLRTYDYSEQEAADRAAYVAKWAPVGLG